MPSNPYKEQRECYAQIQRILNNITDEGIELDSLVLNAITAYPVGEKQVRDFIKRFFIDRDLVELRHGIVYPAKTARLTNKVIA